MLSAILKRQLAGEAHLPHYNFHVRKSIVSFEDGRVGFVVRTKGVPFQVTSAKRLESNYNDLNTMLLSVGKSTGSRLALWCHVDHYETQFKTAYKFGYQWLRDFSARYMEKFAATPIFENAFYMTFVLKQGANDNLEECIRELEEIQLMISQYLQPYECEVLRSYRHKGSLYSEVYEFFAYLYNGFWERVPVTSLPCYQTIESSTLHHGYKLIETRFPDGGNTYSAYFDLKDFPEPTVRGKLNPLLELKFPFVLCMSFTFLLASESVKLINATLNKMESAGDEASDQHDDMAVGKGAIMSGEIYFGELHGALMVRGATERQVEDRGANARTTLSGSCGTLFVPATISAPATFFSLFPGNVKSRPRVMPKTTRNLLGMFGMNTYSSGKQRGNPIGDGSAVMPLKTTANGVYHFNFHYSLPAVDAVGDKLAGHTVIFGATGVGKTTTQTALLAHLERFDCGLFGLDKDGSMRGMIEALGGTYFTLAANEPTGLNPMQLPDTPFNRGYLNDLVAACGRRANKELSAEDTKDIKQAVDNVFELPFEQRRFGVLLQSIPDRGEDCLARRLAAWCYGEQDGRFAYALDNPTNNFDWEKLFRVGFDVTDFLKDGHPATEPILSYLLHVKTLMQRSGMVMATVVEEFWLPLKYPTTAAQILDVLKTGRRRDEFIVLVTQSPEDAIASPLFPTILQQTPTKIFLANPEAEFKTEDGLGGYVRTGMTEKEFIELEKLGALSRKFIVKQGSQSAVVGLDLHGLGDYIAVLAMAQEDFQYLDAAKAAVGGDPDAWVPRYIELRREGRARRRLDLSQPETEEEIA